MGFTYTIGFWLEKYTPLLFFIGTLPKFLCLDLWLLSQTISSGQLEPDYCFFKLCCRQTLEVSIRLCSSLHIYLVYEIYNWLVEHFSSQIQLFLVKDHAVFIKLSSNILVNMWRRALGLVIHQVAWALLCALSALWLISHSGPVVEAVSSWAHATIL